MTARILAQDCEPDLTHEDIAWGRHGLARYRLELGDEGSYCALAREALHATATLTTQLQRVRVVIPALRDEIRVLRAENQALFDEVRALRSGQAA
jgi:hypothetical protein